MAKKKYVEAVKGANGYYGRVYQYLDGGEREQVVVRLSTEHPTKEEAQDEAAAWCEERNLECEIDFGD